jgi:hypothetical protein
MFNPTIQANSVLVLECKGRGRNVRARAAKLLNDVANQVVFPAPKSPLSPMESPNRTALASARPNRAVSTSEFNTIVPTLEAYLSSALKLQTAAMIPVRGLSRHSPPREKPFFPLNRRFA